MVKNQLHAETVEAEPNETSVIRLKQRIDLLDRQAAEIVLEIKKLTQVDPEIKATIDLLCSIPGIGIMTAVAVVAETNGFDLIRNKKQLTSYAGLDVKEKHGGARALWYLSKRKTTHFQKRQPIPKKNDAFARLSGYTS